MQFSALFSCQLPKRPTRSIGSVRAIEHDFLGLGVVFPRTAGFREHRIVNFHFQFFVIAVNQIVMDAFEDFCSCEGAGEFTGGCGFRGNDSLAVIVQLCCCEAVSWICRV